MFPVRVLSPRGIYRGNQKLVLGAGGEEVIRAMYVMGEREFFPLVLARGLALAVGVIEGGLEKPFLFLFFFLPPRRGGISKMKTNERRMGGFLSNPNRPWKNRAFETDRYEKSTRVSYPYSNKCIIKSSSLATIRLEQTRAASKRKL